MLWDRRPCEKLGRYWANKFQWSFGGRNDRQQSDTCTHVSDCGILVISKLSLKKKIISKSFVLGCDTYTLDGSEITEGDQMGLPARDRDYLQIILSIFILLKLRMLQTLPLSFFLCRYSEGLEFSYNENNGFICRWRWVFLSACPYATKLRVIPCSLGDSGLSM